MATGVLLIVSDLLVTAALPELGPLALGPVAFPLLGRLALAAGLVILTLIYARRIPSGPLSYGLGARNPDGLGR